jgi:hypothetical protein
MRTSRIAVLPESSETQLTEFADRLDGVRSDAVRRTFASCSVICRHSLQSGGQSVGTFSSNDSLTNERRMIGCHEYFSYVCAQNWIVR